ncbi:MAG: HAD-IIIC family phosphatase [Verrucomicrobiae bacterium]|nr:HAD-IIIC family phosphatase [Verrucomicrobiae bacterium]
MKLLMTPQEQVQQICRETNGCLDIVKLMKQARMWTRCRNEGKALFSQSRRLALLCGATSETYAPLLEVCMAARGLHVELWQSPYGSWQQQILDPNSALQTFRPEMAVLHLTLSQLTHFPSLTATPAEAGQAAEQDAAEILDWCEKLRSRHPIPIFLANFHPPPHESLSNLAARQAGAASQHVLRVNLRLAERAPRHITLVDIHGMASRYGVQRWIDLPGWYHAKQPMAYDAMPLFAQSLSAVIASACLGSAKCVALDLDNTLWGGVAADDGLDGIRLGQGNSQGEAFQDFQRYLLELRRRGILLAVASKNQDAIAREVFERHDQMLIKLPDCSAFMANFNPKADNLRAIAKQLNIGLDSLVFVDDNPVEREQMRQLAPEVKVVDLPDDPAHYIRALEQAFLFESQAVTAEDLARAESYAANRKREALAARITDVGEFLRSLQMNAFVAPYGEPYLERISQLINKSNQFNLCTARYSQAEVAALAADPDRVTLGIRLRDRFGDNGLISAIHGRINGDTLEIENWVMSCRVLDRGVEQLAINHLADAGRGRGCRRLTGRYIPTPKNALVREHYSRLGFQKTAETPEGRTDWALDLEQFKPFQPPID